MPITISAITVFLLVIDVFSFLLCLKCENKSFRLSVVFSAFEGYMIDSHPGSKLCFWGATKCAASFTWLIWFSFRFVACAISLTHSDGQKDETRSDLIYLEHFLDGNIPSWLFGLLNFKIPTKNKSAFWNFYLFWLDQILRPRENHRRLERGKCIVQKKLLD